MPLTDAEVEDLRFHLGYGNLGLDAQPYTPDGFYDLFHGVIAPNLTEKEATTATTAVVANTLTTVTPGAMTGIVAGAQLVVDVADDAEIIWVKSVTVSTFTARFAKAHPVTGYPIVVNCGLARLRMLLHSANRAWERVQSSETAKAYGLKGIGRKELEWFDNHNPCEDAVDHYRGIALQIAALVRVEPQWLEAQTGASQLEAY